ncbi:uncharacterized protein At4g06744-like [Andrographis paniculata]|uniref:uncharacterized protein At4g06744-like n=1 Tax=Andrographis paniculata TaxID=175694 RepID=UPI0021E80CEB|nr:uncharacterized protein At4g06744-like [Andrographis paniculata]
MTKKQCPILTTTQILILAAAAAAAAAISRPLAPPPASDDLVFADQRLAIVYPVIQRFKALITSDPFNVTASWIGSDICNYKGFYCESPPDNGSALALASIDFNGFRLSAPTLDEFLDQLPDIALFHANSNDFSGTISPDIANLPYLYELDISNNRLSGPFPPAILAMDGLSFLDLRFNAFSGSVPPELFTRASLDALFLNNNHFTAALPDCSGASAGDNHIIYLTLANNKFSGDIPGAALSRNLSELLLLNNMFSGCLPHDIGKLESAVVIDAGNNRLTGHLPYSLGCLRRLEILNLAGNLLYGRVPERVCRLENLANLSLSDNYLTGFGQACWRLIKNGVLDLTGNCVPGLPLQRPVDECVEFFTDFPLRRRCWNIPAHASFPCWFL